MTFTYIALEEPGTGEPKDRDRVRLLLNDVDKDSPVFQDQEIALFLELEGDNVKLAAATAIDTNATNEALASKVLRTQDLGTDGAKVADAMRAHAARLREQVDAGEGYFEIIDAPSRRPELTEGGWH